MGLPDFLAHELKVIFIGFNPGERSEELGHHFAGRNNQFWRILHQAGLTERVLSPEEDQDMLPRGYGLTNIVARMTKSSADLTRNELMEGGRRLRKLLTDYGPQVACFLGKDVYRGYAGLKTSVKVEYGLQGNQLIPGLKEFVAPNPSGRSTIPLPEKIRIMRELKELLD